MQTKICTTCQKEKTISCFSKHKECKYGVRCKCKECIRDYTRTEIGHIEKIYRNQINRSRLRVDPPPEYTVGQLIKWATNQEIFHILYNAWVESGFDKWLAPSFDRIDDYCHYTLNNLQIVTWRENNYRYMEDAINGVNRKRCKSVLQYDLDGNFIKEYYSVRSAARETGIDQAGISRVCRGELRKTHGFIFEFI